MKGLKLTLNEKLFGVAAICGVILVGFLWYFMAQTPIEIPVWGVAVISVLTVVMILCLIVCGVRKLTGASEWDGLVD